MNKYLSYTFRILILYIFTLCSCAKLGSQKDSAIHLYLKEITDYWKLDEDSLEGKKTFKRDILMELILKNESRFDAFVPIRDNSPFSTDTLYQSRLALSLDGHIMECEIEVERKWTVSSAPHVLYLRYYQTDERGTPILIKEKRLQNGDLRRKIYSNDSVPIFVLVNDNHLREAGFDSNMDVNEFLGKLRIEYRKDDRDMKFDDLPISDIVFDRKRAYTLTTKGK